jgi:hypothetical protein
MSIVACMLQGALRARRQLHAERDLRQTEFLLQAGADRAAFRLNSEANYRGERWDIQAERIVGRGDGQVTISAARDPDDEPWRVEVLAEYPVGGDLSIRRSNTFFVQSRPLQE